MPHYPYPEMPRFFVDALGIRTAYYEMGKGNGRAILLVHGMSSSGDSFREAMHELADDFWLIAPDIPGFGDSADTRPYTIPHLVEWLAAFVAALELPPLALVGHSFGGTLAASFAAAYPDAVTRMLLLAPALLRSESYPRWAMRLVFGLRIIDLGFAAAQSKQMLSRHIRQPFYDAGRQDESVWARRRYDYERARASTDVLRASAFYHTRPFLPRLTQPTCLLWGENDLVLPVSDADTLAALLPNVKEVHKFSQCGHVLMLERQEEFQAIARRFFSE